MPIVSVPKILRDKLTDEGADALIELLNKTEVSSRVNILEISENKFEKRLTEVKTSLEMKIEQVRTSFEVKLAQTEAKIIKWMFIFWVGQIFSITAILFAFFKR